ncbi:glucosamine-6-phosphate deaminase [Patescibacteria group bacterium]|nr:glucosamine-6-phosphate deaminase [Patescibacteria group bacterium]
MKIIIKKTYEDLSKEAAKIISEGIRKKPNLVLGLATGSTPLGTYQELIRMHKEEGLDFSKIITFNLDEYLGLSRDHKQSYSFYLYENLLNHININPQNIYPVEGKPKDVKIFCQEYEQKIQKMGGIDLQILGIGSDGHIGFNEPGTLLTSRTHLAKLAESTIKDNSRFFEREEDVPRFAMTMGLGTIFETKMILLLASGPKKAEACARFIEEPITPQVPASILQRHPNTVIILDIEAASKLKTKY